MSSAESRLGVTWSSPPRSTIDGTLLLRRRRAWRRQTVLNVLPTYGDERAHALGGQDRRDARGPASPIVSSQGGRAYTERVHEIEEVLADGSLLGHAWRRGVQEARRPIAAQVRNQHAIASGDEPRRHAVERSHVVGEPVQQDDGKTAGGARGLVADLEHGCAHRKRGHRDRIIHGRDLVYPLAQEGT